MDAAASSTEERVVIMKMKFRIVKDGWLCYKAQATYNGRDWVTLDYFFTKHGAKQYCTHFAEHCNYEPKINIVEEFDV